MNPQKILFISPVNFDALRQRHQAMAQELIKAGFEVVYIEPVKSFGFGLRLKKSAGRLKIFSVFVPFKGVNHYYTQLLSSFIALKIIVKRLKIKPESTVLWCAEPSMPAFAFCRWQRLIYDRCDYHGHFKNQNALSFMRYEAVLFERANVISVSHPFLLNDISRRNLKKAVLAPNACSSEFLSLCKTLPRPTGPRGGKIRVVSSGAHFEWVDFDFLFMLADCGAIELNIAGAGRTKRFFELIKNKNVKFHGMLSQKELAELLISCDAAVLPFLDTELIKGVNPVKLYEFAAAALPVWAPRLECLKANPYISAFIASKRELCLAIRGLKAAKAAACGHRAPLWGEQALKILKSAGLIS